MMLNTYLQSPSFLLMLFILHFPALTRSQDFQPFPIEDCGNKDIDIVFIANNFVPHEYIQIQMSFFQNILHILMPPAGKPRSASVQVALTFAPIVPKDNISFVEYSGNMSQYFSQKTYALLNIKQIVYADGLTLLHDSAYKLFSGARKNAIKLVLLVMDRIWENWDGLILHQNSKIRHGIIRTFVAFVSSNTKFDGIPYTVRVSDYKELLNNQRFSLALCKRCHKEGWTVFQDSMGLSCHKIVTAKTCMHWYKARAMCADEQSEMAGLESQEEIRHVRKLKQTTYRHLFLRKEDEQMDSGFDSMFIGLYKDEKEFIRNFKWPNNRPVLIQHWWNNRSGGDPNQSCAVWLFTFEKEMNDSSTNEEIVTTEEGWADIGCGVLRTNAVLCEVSVVYHTSDRLSSLKVSPANLGSYNKASRRQEFIDFNGKIVSLSSSQYRLVDQTVPERERLIPYFRCTDRITNPMYLSYSLVCDFQTNCGDGADENKCYLPPCNSSTEFQCRINKQCIPLSARCDFFRDCLDGSDEENCACNGMMCCSGRCLPRNLYLDGEVDCAPCLVQWAPTKNFGIHDEMYNNKTDEVVGCVFICNRTQCVVSSQLNDSVVDCTGPEGPLDETIGRLQSVNACAIQTLGTENLLIVPWSPKCIYLKDRLGAIIGCRNLAHLQGCKNFECPEGYVKCPDSYCIPLHFLQDGEVDCPWGEDEIYQVNRTCAGNFECSNSQICLHPDLVCDGRAHCPLADDELNCEVSCKQGFFCIAGTVVVSDYKKSEPLTSLAFFDPKTRYLDLSGINMSLILTVKEQGHFVNMYEIRMSNCSLQAVDGQLATILYNVATVAFMDLSYNRIHTVSNTSVFKNMLNLRHLNISNNKELTDISGGCFCSSHMDCRLEVLDLSETSILFVDETTFKDLNNLKLLNLSSTKINQLQSRAFPSGLFALDLRLTKIEEFLPDCLVGLSNIFHMFTDNYKLCCPQIRGRDILESNCYTPQDAISSCSDLIAVGIQRVFIWLLGIVSILGNGLVITYRMMTSKDAKYKACNTFVINLGISDIIMGIYLLIIAVADLHYREIYLWNDTAWKRSTLCRLAGFLSVLSCETSTFFIFLITADRYTVLKFPFGQYNFSKYATIFCTLGSWMFGFLLAYIPFLPNFFSAWETYSSNGMCLALPLTTMRQAGWEYSLAIFVALNFVMFVAIASGQYLIYKAVSDNRMTKANDSQNNSRRVQDINLAKQLSLVAVSNFLCWCPVGVMGLLALNGSKINSEAYAWSAVLVLPVNSALNPILYTIPILLQKWNNFKLGYFKQKPARLERPQKISLGIVVD